ncbi:MAG TPA: tripartite tricarboxylate transporter permease, partial [Thermodesulfobacteriota bacterium]|nr:tripartite tricarboxylate transporter permease [Thermodesulfobacteriota bacterium]
GPVATISILIPITMGLPAVSAIIMLSGIFYGAMYGGSTTSILVNLPGEAASVVTCFDGHQMALRGRAGPALGIAAFGSFIAGTLGVVGLMLIAEPMARFALKFGPPEYFGVMFLGLTLVCFLTRGSLLKSILMAFVGLILAYVGQDSVSGDIRLTLNSFLLWDGIGLMPLIMGLFGVSEVLFSLEKPVSRTILEVKGWKNLLPNRKDWKDSAGPMIRGGILGFILGVMPGGGTILATFASYSVERRISKNPDEFGKGAIAGVAGPETANNAASSGSFITLFTLGIPPNVVIATLLGAMMIHGIQPGPLFLKEHPQVFWGVVASMYLGNVMLLLLNLPFIGLWVKVLRVPYRVLFPVILLLTLVGVYTVRNKPFDLVVLGIFGILGYLLKKFEYEAAPLVLAFILGDQIEMALRQSLILFDGSFRPFLMHPIASATLGMGLLILISPLLPWLGLGKKIADEAAKIEDG